MRERIERLTRDKDEALVLARALDWAEQARRRGVQAGDFLEPRMQQLVGRVLAEEKHTSITWQGGYEGAERCRLVLHTSASLPDPQIAFIKVKGVKDLQHRDCLGSLLGLGLRREKLGDLLPQENYCYMVVAHEVTEFIIANLLKVGHQEVQVAKIENLAAVITSQPKIIQSTVASLRLDAIIATGFSVSRNEAHNLVAGEKVKLNYQVNTRPDRLLTEGDLVSIRGYGRVRLITLGGKSRKDRIHITLERY